MNDADFFPARPDVEPMIYAYEEKNPRYAGMLKVGFASAGVERRVAEQFPDSIQRIAKQGEFDEFSLNEFFAARGAAGRRSLSMRTMCRSGSTSSVAATCQQASMTLSWDKTSGLRCHIVILACSACCRTRYGSCPMWLRALPWPTS